MGCGPSQEANHSPEFQSFSLLAAETPCTGFVVVVVCHPYHLFQGHTPNFLERVVTVDEVESLYELYTKLSNSVVKDGYIQKEELQFALFRNTNKRSLFFNRMFDLFDINQNGRIEFGEFVRALGIFHPKTPETEKIRYAFWLYDLRGTGYIEREELKEMVLALLHESDLHLSNEIVETIVDKTFKEVDSKGDAKIDMEEWEEYVVKNPSLLKNMTLPYLMDITLSFPSFVVNKDGEGLQRPSKET